MKRRPFLASIGVTTAGLGSGCLERLRGRSSPPPRLGWVSVSNYSADPQQFQVEIHRDGELVHESTHEVAGKPPERIPGDVLECTWGEERGPYTLRGRVAGTGWVERSVEDALSSDGGTPDCVVAEGVYGRGNSENFAFEVVPDCGGVPTYEGGCAFANSNSDD